MSKWAMTQNESRGIGFPSKCFCLAMNFPQVKVDTFTIG